MAITIGKQPKNPGSTESRWHIYDGETYLGYIRKFADTRTDTSPFQIFDSRVSRERPTIVAAFWKASVDLKGMNPDRHRHGGFAQARKFAVEHFSKVTA